MEAMSHQQTETNLCACRDLLYTASSAASDAVLRAIRGLESQMSNAAGAWSDAVQRSSPAVSSPQVDLSIYYTHDGLPLSTHGMLVVESSTRMQ